MTNYTSKPEHKFTFGLWTVGNTGRDPFGGPAREPKSPGELLHLLAKVGAGVWNDVESVCKTVIKLTGSTLPNPLQVEAYRKAYPIYRESYPALKSSFGRL